MLIKRLVKARIIRVDSYLMLSSCRSNGLGFFNIALGVWNSGVWMKPIVNGCE